MSLSSWGCHVKTCKNDSQVIELVCGKPVTENSNFIPEVLISDYHLQDGKNGIALSQELTRALTRKLSTNEQYEIPVIILSGDTSSMTKEQVSKSGYTFLSKPVSPAKLRACLNAIVSR